MSPAPAETSALRHRRRMWRPGAGLAAAVGFLTIVPVPARLIRDDAGFELGPALPWFPLVGAGVGAAGGGVRVACEPLLGRGPATVLAMGVLVVLSGALHQDALADTADGFGARGDRARRLAIMRDSSLGAFGVLALLGWALLLFATLQGLPRGDALLALTVAGAGGRLAAVAHGWAAPPARRDGLGAAVRVTAGRGLAAAIAGAAVAVLVVGPARGALALAVAVAVAVAAAGWARQALGGSTGDTLGAVVAAAELAVCLALAASW